MNVGSRSAGSAEPSSLNRASYQARSSRMLPVSRRDSRADQNDWNRARTCDTEASQSVSHVG